MTSRAQNEEGSVAAEDRHVEPAMSWFNRTEDEEKYRRWLAEHRDTGFVLNCFFCPSGDAATLHLAACGHLLAEKDLHHTSASFPKKCGDALDELLNWAASELTVKIKGCRCLRRAYPRGRQR